MKIETPSVEHRGLNSHSSFLLASSQCHVSLAVLILISLWYPLHIASTIYDFVQKKTLLDGLGFSQLDEFAVLYQPPCPESGLNRPLRGHDILCQNCPEVCV